MKQREQPQKQIESTEQRKMDVNRTNKGKFTARRNWSDYKPEDKKRIAEKTHELFLLCPYKVKHGGFTAKKKELFEWYKESDINLSNPAPTNPQQLFLFVTDNLGMPPTLNSPPY